MLVRKRERKKNLPVTAAGSQVVSELEPRRPHRGGVLKENEEKWVRGEEEEEGRKTAHTVVHEKCTSMS